ncbi:MAG: TlpA family protein disulfide reductase [Bacteroidetes bacterium]|nr:TlpA family protein disulfide reductase [Bacteroidota bacterium]
MKVFLLFLISGLYANILVAQDYALLTGKIDSLPDKTVMQVFSNEGYKASFITNNGEFKFVIPSSQEWDVYFINCLSPKKDDGFNFPLLLKAGSKLNFHANENLDEYIITGDENAQEQNDFWTKLAYLSSNFKDFQRKISETKDSEGLKLLNEQLKVFEIAIDNFPKEWIITHKSSPFSCAAIRFFVERNIRIEDSLAETYFDMLTPEAKNNNFQATILQEHFARHNSKYDNNQVGSVISKDLLLEDTSGKAISLNSFRDKYILIDFWASWCLPCRENNPLLKQLYGKFYNKGFDIYGVSLDTDKSKWKSAIVKDKLIWPQGSDLKGVTGDIAKDYLIGSIPRYILISPDKKILANSGNIVVIEKKLTELFENKLSFNF